MTEDQIERLVCAVEELAGGKTSGPSGVEGVAIALAGRELNQPVGDALYCVAEALDRIANAIEASKK